MDLKIDKIYQNTTYSCCDWYFYTILLVLLN